MDLIYQVLFLKTTVMIKKEVTSVETKLLQAACRRTTNQVTVDDQTVAVNDGSNQ